MAQNGIKFIDLSAYPRPYVGNAASPFRYPGGKGFLTPLLSAEIKKSFGTEQPHYAEPYCGGAGAAVNLLFAGVVDRLFLNDADYRIYSAWRAIVTDTNRFLSRLADVEVSLATWEASLQKLYERPTSEYDFEIGFAAFFINRTSRSGVLLGSGPIGGYSQEGIWKIDARFNKEGLSKKIRALGELSNKIFLSRKDGIEFCGGLDNDGLLSRTFLFIDPPYVGAGGRLYHDGMDQEKHAALARWLRSGVAPHWLLTYDDHPIVHENFEGFDEHRIQVQYSLGRKRSEKELLYKSVI